MSYIQCNGFIHISMKKKLLQPPHPSMVLGKAHVRQMDAPTRKQWLKELKRNRSKPLDAPSWLWSSIVELVKSHEGGYLEHCRKFALRSAKYLCCSPKTQVLASLFRKQAGSSCNVLV
jgi:hypothetical protein